VRIIAGAYRGRRLKAPKGKDIRPTTDRVREAVFNVIGRRVEGSRVLDLFAGTGAMGLEALSRGAERTAFVERSAEAVRLIRANAALCGAVDRVVILQGAVPRALRKLAAFEPPFDLVFADPPYGEGWIARLLPALSGVCSETALLICEHGAAEPVPEGDALWVRTDSRRYRDTAVSFYERRPQLFLKGGDMDKLAVYPGSFDPITNGHLDLMQRALKIFDRVIIAVASNPAKEHLFTLEERVRMIRESLTEHPLCERVTVETFDGLLVNYVEKKGAKAIIRGLRAVSDFEYEFQMALMNRKLCNDIETLYLMTGMRWIYISSRIIKEVVVAGGGVKGLVPDVVERMLNERLAARKATGVC
jgi:pantetheine-phosphate adenylyltransferase